MAKAPPPKPQPKKPVAPPPKPRSSIGEGDSEPQAFIPPPARPQPPLAEDELEGSESFEFISLFEVERRQKRWLMASGNPPVFNGACL